MQTNCKNCEFAIYENKTQIGCQFDRLNKFKDYARKTQNNDEEFYIIDRACNYYRDSNRWDETNDKQIVQEESAVSFDVIFNYEALTQEECDSIISFINDESYYKHKINIMLLHEYDHDNNVKDFIVQISSASKRNIVVTLCHPTDEFLNSYILKSKNGYHILVNKNITKITHKLLSDINKVINEDLKQCVVFNKNDIFAIHNLAYRLYAKHNAGLKYNDYKQHLIDQAKQNNFYTEF